MSNREKTLKSIADYGAQSSSSGCSSEQMDEVFVDEKHPCSHSSIRARRNWSVFSERLRDALKRKKFNDRSELILFDVKPVPNTECMLISESGSSDCYTVKFVAPDRRVSLGSLAHEFDNTGNIRIWPGSEALAWLLLQRSELIRGETCLELGAGFLGLSSFVLTQKCPLVDFWVTDGNENSVESLEHVKLTNSKVSSRIRVCQLLWGTNNLGVKFDTILAADCVFFEQFHDNFIQCIISHLKTDGVVYICSPERKGSLRKFTEKLEKDWPCLEMSSNSEVSLMISEKFKGRFLSKSEIDENVPVFSIIRFRCPAPV